MIISKTGSFLLVFALLLLSPAATFAMGTAAPPENATLTSNDLPISKIVLFSTGLGYFQRTGVVEESAVARLAFRNRDINDLLKSMVLQDFDGGSIASVNYSSREPLAVTLRSLAVDLSGNPGMVGIISQLRGDEIIVNVKDGGLVRGSVIGVENQQVLNLYTKWGITSVDIIEIESVRFPDPVIEEEFHKALELLAGGRKADEKQVTLAFSGEGQRRVLVGYLLETPVWKTSYRLVLGEEDEHMLQGWAIVENTTAGDWNDVRLSLVSGRPVSFQMDLYTPIYNPRPTIRVETERALSLQEYQEPVRVSKSAAPMAESMAAPPSELAGGFFGGDAGAGAFDDFDVELDIGRGVDSAAVTQRAGEFFHYVIEESIDLPRGESAMVPIVNETITGEKVSIYNPSSGFSHPFNGVRFTNTTGIDLSSGPITVFEADTYAGDSRIGSLPAGGERLISFSLDLGTTVTMEVNQRPERLVELSISEGILVANYLGRRDTGYSLVGRGVRERTVLVEHAFLTGWTLVEPKLVEEKAASLYRFAVVLPEVDSPAGVEEVLLVAEERISERRTDLLGAGNAFLQSYIDAEEVAVRVKTFFRGILERRQAIVDTVNMRSIQENRRSTIYREQDRIRKNMVNLDDTTDLYKEYVDTLTNQESELKMIADRIEELVKREEEQREELEEYVRSIQYDRQ